MSVLYGKVRIHGEAGQTITITTPKGQSKQIQTTGQNFTDIALAGMEEYTLSNGSMSEDILLNVGDFKEIDMSNIPQDLESATWEQIKNAIINGTFTQFASVGDTKSFEIDGKTYHAEVVAINDGTGDAAQWYPDNTVDFICTEIYTSKKYNATRTNSGGFPSSEIKDTLNNTIYPLLPTDLKNVIIDKSHSYQAGSYSSNWSSSMVTSADKLWLPTYYEMAGATNVNAVGETSSNNKKYTLTSKIKKTYNGVAGTWWLCSPYCGSSNGFWFVTTTGTFNYSYADLSDGVPICFRIGQGGEN